MKHKRILLILLSITLLLSLFTGCKEKPVEQPEDSYQPPEEKTLTLGDTAGSSELYNIIYSASANETVKSMVKALQTDIKSASGVVLRYYTDTSKSTTESPREIIIGKTFRQASTDVLARITGIGYRIERVEEKIVIAASNDDCLEAALEKLKSLFTVADGALKINLGLLEETSDADLLPLMVDGSIPFRVVIPAKGYSNDLYNAAQDICSFIGSVNETTVRVTFDKDAAEEDGAYEICLGKTNRAGSQKLYDGLSSYFKYEIRIEGNRIFVGGLIDTELVKGVKAFQNEFARVFDGTYAGTPSLPLDFGGVYVSSNVSDDLPLPDDGTMKQILDCGRNSFILYYQDVNEQSSADPEKSPLDAYIEKMQAAGAVLNATYALGENSYALFKHESYTAYASYMPAKNYMQVYVGSADDVDPSTEPVADAMRVTPKLWSIQLADSGSNGGMAYMIQTTDGKYLIFDGGCTSKDASRMLEVMQANKPKNHEKPIVTGWFVSHLHEDHYGGLVGMSSKYAEEIVVEAFYYNFAHVSMGTSQTIGASVAAQVEAAMRKWPTAKRCKVHSGQSLYFSGAKINVLATLEDSYTHGDGNDTSTVVQVEIGGQKITFLGDSETSQSQVLARLGGEILKSDIVQFSHHGYYDGVTREVYMMLDPEYLLWPMCIMSTPAKGNTNLFKSYFFQTAGGGAAQNSNSWARTNTKIKEIIVSGAGTICLPLPYTVGTSDFKGPTKTLPSGALIADYDAIYEEQLAEYQDSLK